MPRSLTACLALSVAVSGCVALVKYNDGERVALEHDGTISSEAVQAKADEACALTGSKRAQHLATVHKVAGNPLGPLAAMLSSFRCVPVE